MTPTDIEREAWLDRLPAEIDRAVTWLRDEWTRLAAREAEFVARVGNLEEELRRRDSAIEAARKEIESLRGRSSLFRRLRRRWTGR